MSETPIVHEQLAALEAVVPGLAERVAAVPGVAGVVLGGSRARGTHEPSSDFDLGVYYGDGFDIPALQLLVDEVGDSPSAISQPGGWGPWVDGGGWLVVGGVHVDLIYRRVERVRDVWSDCVAGRFTNAIQAGHPLGFWSHAYAGELALGIPATDLHPDLGELRAATTTYPEPLADALVAALWEAEFSLANARKAIERSDVAYVAGCLFRAVGVTAHSLHGHGRQWLLNEKGATASAANLPASPVDFHERVDDAFASLAPDVVALERACSLLDGVVADVTDAINR